MKVDVSPNLIPPFSGFTAFRTSSLQNLPFQKPAFLFKSMVSEIARIILLYILYIDRYVHYYWATSYRFHKQCIKYSYKYICAFLARAFTLKVNVYNNELEAYVASVIKFTYVLCFG